MAVIVNQNENDPNAPQNGSQQFGGVTPVGQGQGAGASPGAPMAVGAPQAKTAGSGQFVNLQKYLQANQGGGERLAGQISKTGQNEANQASDAVNNASTTIGSQLDAEKNRIAQASGFANQINQDPTQIVNNADQFAAFNQLKAGQTAANDISNNAANQFNTAQNAINDVSQFANNSGNESGRFELLRQTMNRPTYTQGQQKLDQLFLQNGGNGTLNNLQKTLNQNLGQNQAQFADAQSNYATGLGDVNTSAAAAKQQLLSTLGGLDAADPGTGVSTTGGYIPPQGTGALGALQSSLYNKQQDYIHQQTAAQQDMASQIARAQSDGVMSQDLASRLGLGNGSKLYNINLNDVLKPSFQPGTVTEQGVADANDLARYSALSQLSGAPSQYLNQSNIGGAKGMDLNQANWQQALAGAKAQEQGVLHDIENVNFGPTPTFAGGMGLGQSQVNSNVTGLQSQIADLQQRIKDSEDQGQPVNPELGEQMQQAQGQLDRWQQLQKLNIFNTSMDTETALRNFNRQKAAAAQLGVGTGFGRDINQLYQDINERSSRLQQFSPDRFLNVGEGSEVPGVGK